MIRRPTRSTRTDTLFPYTTLFRSFLIDNCGWEMAWRLLGLFALVTILPVALIMRRQPEDHGWLPDGLTDDGDDSSPAGAQRAAVRADFENSFTRHEALRTRALYLIVLAFGVGAVGIPVSLVQIVPFQLGRASCRERVCRE